MTYNAASVKKYAYSNVVFDDPGIAFFLFKIEIKILIKFTVDVKYQR